jgi:hypothetical protein
MLDFTHRRKAAAPSPTRPAAAQASRAPKSSSWAWHGSTPPATSGTDRADYFRPGRAAGGGRTAERVGTAELDPRQQELRVGSPHDEHERQADRAADGVVEATGGRAATLPALSAPRPKAAGGGEADRAGDSMTLRPEGGAPLPAGTRTFMERSFGQDFGDVRLHTDHQAAALNRRLDARAFTTGNHVYVAPSELAAGARQGRHLLAHELAHVVQQRSVPRAGMVQRESGAPTTGAAPPQPTTITNTQADQNQWRGRVNQAVRALFGLGGPGLTAANTQFLAPQAFAAQLPAEAMEEALFSQFLARGDDITNVYGQILDFNNVRSLTFNSSIFDPTNDRLRQFIRAGINAGQFRGRSREYLLVPGPGGGFVGQPQGPFTVPARDLAASTIGGVASVTGPRAQRTVAIQSGTNAAGTVFEPYVHTLVHEACHFYADGAFRAMAETRTDGREWLAGAQIRQILVEGFAERFARQVMDANAAQFGPRQDAYRDETSMANRIAETVGEARARQAYFSGDAQQLRRVGLAVDAHKRSRGELILPSFIIDTPANAAAP